MSEPSTFNEDLTYEHVGKDISCNLGSLNIARTMDSPDFGKTIETAVRGLTAVSDLSNIASVPSIQRGNAMSHAIEPARLLGARGRVLRQRGSVGLYQHVLLRGVLPGD